MNLVRTTLTSALVCLGLAACGSSEPEAESSGDPQVDKAIAFLTKTSSEKYIRKHDAEFLAIQGSEHGATDWVEYAFSTLGTRDWVTEGSEEASYRVPGMKLVPSGVSMFPGELGSTIESHPDYERLKEFGASQPVQVMVAGNDATGQVVVKAYRDWSEPPIYETSWAFPRF